MVIERKGFLPHLIIERNNLSFCHSRNTKMEILNTLDGGNLFSAVFFYLSVKSFDSNTRWYYEFSLIYTTPLFEIFRQNVPKRPQIEIDFLD